MNNDEQKTPTSSPINGGGSEASATPPFMDGTGEVLQKQCDEYLAGWKRALADYENLQKQNAQLRADDRRRIVINLAHELLPVVDNFDQAMKHAPADVDKNWFAGVSHIARQFESVLAFLGMAPIDAVGKIFDPHEHESGGARSEESKPDHEVLEEIVKGWKMSASGGGDLVIRPAKVIVNQK